MANSAAAAVALLALAGLAGCDFAERAELRRERSDRAYRAAMDDYRAGRLAQAVAGLRKVCADNPSNASARFQLACLLQDSEKDFLGAYCAYREYLAQHPGGDKTKIAEDRLAECERGLAVALADKYSLNAAGDGRREAEKARAELAKAEARNAALSKELEEAGRRAESLGQEVARLKRLMRDEAAQDEAAPPDEGDIAAAKALLDGDGGDDGTAPPPDELAEARRLLEDGGDESPMLSQSPDARERRDAARSAAKDAEAAKKVERQRQGDRPETYVVQEGDTLYKIAVKFYGRASAWRGIREANKATISTDGRVKTGQKIFLPKQ